MRAVNQYYRALNRGVAIAPYGPLHAFGFRYGLIDGYSGPLFKIRRSSDNATLDCYSLSDATSFVGANHGHIDTWYNHTNSISTDQHLKQTTLSQQPRLIISGVVQTINGKAAINFAAGQFLWNPLNLLRKARTIHYCYKTVQTSSFILLSYGGDPCSFVATNGSLSTAIHINYTLSGFRLIKNGTEITVPSNRDGVYDQMLGTNVWTEVDVGFPTLTPGFNLANYNNNATFKYLGEVAEIVVYGNPEIVTPGGFDFTYQQNVNNSMKSYFGI